MDNFINIYNENKTNNTEFEITYHLSKSFLLYKNLFNKLKDLSENISIIENIDIYYDNNTRVTKQFKSGININKDIIIKKTPLLKSLTLNNIINNVKFIKVKLNEENKIKILGLSKIKMIRMKLRLSFQLKNNNDYNIDLDLIKNFNINNNNIKEVKDLVFKPYKLSNIIEDINYSLFDEILLETEFFSKVINEEIINNSIDLVQSLLNSENKSDYQKYIYNIAKYIISNKIYLENFKHKSGLKKLLNNVIELNSDIYCKHILPNIENYYITDKIDGKRCICYIEEYMNCFNIKLVSNKIYQIKEYNNNLNKADKDNFKVTILDCELILQNDNELISEKDINLYIFDIITYENNKLGFEPFENRFNYLDKGYDKIRFLSNVQVKEYIKLTNNYKTELQNFYNKKINNKYYDIDGLIFTPNSNVKNTEHKYPINTNYNNMIGYKWKPIEHMTIDFYILKLPKNLYNFKPYNNLKLSTNDNIYILFSGISKQDFDKLNFTYINNYNKIIPEKYLNNTYFPIQFSTSDNPHNYIYISNDDNLHNKIGEFLYDTNNKKWNLKKIRDDRDIELERGEYFGNYYKIAELIWMSINNPLDINKMINDNAECYFQIDDNILYKAQRSFNSYVKSKSLENIISDKLYDKNNTDWVIDLAAGKGQDLARLNNLNFKNGLFLDKDKNALLELINRKFTLKSYKKSNIKIFTKNIDLLDNYNDIIKDLDIFNIEKESVDVMICNFAIHYIIINEDKLLNLIKLLNNYLKPGGRFIFTCFNGYKIFKLLEHTDVWNSYDDENNLKYSIKKLYNSNKLLPTGQKIDVLLPLSNNYYTEYLMNLDYIFDIFNENNFMSELSLPFSSFLNDFEKDNNKVYNMLSSIDIEYSSLYQVNIIKKKRFNNNIIIKSNIEQLFNNQNYINNINGSSDKYNIDENNNLDQLININNANSILLIVNTTNERLIKDINEKFLELNYKNKNIHKKNKKKIYKIVAFESNNNLYNEWYSIYNLYKKTNYDSIIFYNISLPLTEEYEKILFKQPIIPIILTNNDNNIIIIQNKLLDNIIQNNSDIIHYQNSHNNIYFSNDLNKKIIFTNTNINNNIIKNELKYYDTVN
jgi:SAM-dependent methyltransferase